MIIAQVLKVIPSGEYFEIFDMNKPVLTGYVSTVEKLPVFENVHDDMKYPLMVILTEIIELFGFFVL